MSNLLSSQLPSNCPLNLSKRDWQKYFTATSMWFRKKYPQGKISKKVAGCVQLLPINHLIYQRQKIEKNKNNPGWFDYKLDDAVALLFLAPLNTVTYVNSKDSPDQSSAAGISKLCTTKGSVYFFTSWTKWLKFKHELKKCCGRKQ